MRGNAEYITLRLVRRFLMPRDMHFWGRFVPHYVVNSNETNPEALADTYIRWLNQIGETVEGKRIVEVGSGATRSMGYALSAKGAATVWCLEPYVRLNIGLDAQMRERIGRQKPGCLTVWREQSWNSIRDADIILSKSVLEHVADMDALCRDMRAALKPDGCMLHIVDYRDHFFKHPFHFLQFQQATWDRYLNPGDLPRWTLARHLEVMGKYFDVTVLDTERDDARYAALRDHVSTDFAGDESLGVTWGVIVARNKPTSASETLAPPAP